MTSLWRIQTFIIRQLFIDFVDRFLVSSKAESDVGGVTGFCIILATDSLNTSICGW